MTYEMYNETTVQGMMQWTNVVTDGVFAYGWIVIIMSVILIGALKYGHKFSKALLAATLVGFVVTAGLTQLDIMSSRDFIIMLFLVVFSYIYSYHD